MKVTIEFDSVDQAIVALGAVAKPIAVAPAPAVEKAPRKPRSDAGQARGPQQPNAAGASGAPSGVAVAGNSTTGTTDPSSTAAGSAAGASTSTTPASPTATAPQAPAAVTIAPAAPTSDQVQAAVEKLFNAKGFDDCAAALSRFGVKRGKDLPEASRAEFIRRATDIAEGKYAAADSWPDLA